MSSSERHRSVDAPFPAYAYLWRSALIEVAPGTRKSHFGIARPRRSSHGRMRRPARAIAIRGDRAQDRFGAARRDRADRTAAVEQRTGRADDVGLHLLQALERHRVQEVRRRVQRVRAMDQLLVLFTCVIDEREHAAAAPVGVARAALGELAQDVFGRTTVLGNHRWASTDSVKMLLLPEPRMFDGGIVIESVIVGTSYQ